MPNYTHFYIIKIEFLGYRYHGWQKQKGQKTIQGMVDKTVEFIIGNEGFRTLGCGRTDSKVSADEFYLELFLLQPVNLKEFKDKFNDNLPSDIRVLSINETNSEFNIIQNSKTKEYHYYFTFGDKYNTLNAPLITHFGRSLSIEKMKEASTLFTGKHNFRMFVGAVEGKTQFTREVLSSVIEETTRFNSEFSPDKVYGFKVKSKGFMRYQVRLMMGALELIGKDKLTIGQLKRYIQKPEDRSFENIAPGSGLRLHKVEFD